MSFEQAASKFFITDRFEMSALSAHTQHKLRNDLCTFLILNKLQGFSI